MGKKRILFLHHVSSIGGASYCLLNILKTIDRNSFEPIVALKSDGPLRLEVEKLGVKIEFFPLMTSIPYNQSIYRYKSLKTYTQIKFSMSSYVELLHRAGADIVYLNNMMLYPYLKSAKQLGLSTIIHVREHWPLDEHTRQLKRAQKHVKQYADQVVAINQYSAKMFSASSPTIVHDWIDMDSRYEYRPFVDIFGEDVSQLKVYLYTGGMLNIKGTIQVIDTFSQCTDSDSRLLIVGVEPEIDTKSFKGKLKKVLSAFGYDTYDYAVKKRIKDDSRIFCIPSTYDMSHIMEQAYCNLSFFTVPHANLALAECEIMGTPSIAARTEESVEYSINETLSMLYELGNIDAFRKAVKEFDSKYLWFIDNLKEGATSVQKMFSKEQNQSILNTVFSNFE